MSHSLEPVRKLCSRGVWIYDGEVRKDGDINEVISEYIKVCG